MLYRQRCVAGIGRGGVPAESPSKPLATSSPTSEAPLIPADIAEVGQLRESNLDWIPESLAAMETAE
jgi:hypothetical protein